MIVAVDIDCILNTLTEAVLSVYNEDWNDNLTVDDITEAMAEQWG